MNNQKDSDETVALDDIDRHILVALRHDGRTPFTQIAKQLKVSPGMIHIRYNRMVDLGILKVAAITNPLRMGYKTMAMVGIRTEGNRILEVAEKVASFDEVIYLIVVSGRYDILAEVVVKDHADLLRFITENLYSVEGVRESESFMHLKIAKEVYF